MAEEFKYWAFISYSHQDRAWASWLHKSLERYRVPSRLVGQASWDGTVPRRLYPIFRDRDELPSSADLNSEINRALRASRYLIVICSPRSARSKWVNEEVRSFKALGREDRVISLIVEGEPNVSDDPLRMANECFPPALRFRLQPDGQVGVEPAQPLAADARDKADGKAGARLKLIAGLIHVGLDELRQREQRRRSILLATTAALSLAVAIATSLLAVSAYQARNEARLQTERVQRTKSFFVSIFENINPLRRKDDSPVTMQQALDDALIRIDTELGSDPRLQGDLLDDFGEIRAGLGDLAGAKAMFQRALPLHEQTLPADDPAIANTLVNLGAIENYMGHTLDGRPYLERAVAILERHATTEGDALSNARNGLASVYREAGDLPGAMQQMQRSLAYYRESPGPQERRLGVTLGNLGSLSVILGDNGQAREYFRECLDVIERNLGPRSANLSDCLYGMAVISRDANETAAQIGYAERAAEIAQASFPEGHPWRLRAEIALGEARLAQKRPAEGESLLRAALQKLEQSQGNVSTREVAFVSLGRSRLRGGDAAEARALADAGLSLCAAQAAGLRGPTCRHLDELRTQALAASTGVVGSSSAPGH